MGSLMIVGVLLVAQVSPYPAELAWLRDLLKRNDEMPLGADPRQEFLRIVGLSAFGDETVIRLDRDGRPPSAVLRVRCGGSVLGEEGEDVTPELPAVSEGDGHRAGSRRCEAGSITVQSRKQLTADEIMNVDRLMEPVLWKRRYRAPAKAPAGVVRFFDGTMWVVEGQRKGRVHRVRYASEESPRLCELVRLLVTDVADIPLGECRLP